MLEDSARDLLMRASGFKPEDFTLEGLVEVPQKVAQLTVQLDGWFCFAVSSSNPSRPPYIVTTNGWNTPESCPCEWAHHHIHCKHKERVALVLQKYNARIERELTALALETLAQDTVEHRMLGASLTRPAGFRLFRS